MYSGSSAPSRRRVLVEENEAEAKQNAAQKADNRARRERLGARRSARAAAVAICRAHSLSFHLITIPVVVPSRTLLELLSMATASWSNPSTPKLSLQ